MGTDVVYSYSYLLITYPNSIARPARGGKHVRMKIPKLVARYVANQPKKIARQSQNLHVHTHNGSMPTTIISNHPLAFSLSIFQFET